MKQELIRQLESHLKQASSCRMSKKNRDTARAGFCLEEHFIKLIESLKQKDGTEALDKLIDLGTLS